MESPRSEEIKHEINLNDAEPTFSISIPTIQGSGGSTIYTISLQLENETWQIQRKFSDFSTFHDQIDIPEEHVDNIDFPNAAISLLFSSAESRRDQLEVYLKAIAKIPSIFQSWEFSYLVGGLKGRLYRQSNSKETSGKILFPLPDKDFDPTECAIPWKVLTMEGFEVVFATETAQKAAADDTLINTSGVIWMARMGASSTTIAVYKEMFDSVAFSNPISWADIDPNDYDAIHLTGGHAPGMKQYLEAQTLMDKIVQYSAIGRTISAICHGSLLLARSVDPSTGHSVVYQKKLTSLPHWMEDVAWNVTRMALDKHYRTYEQYCEDEVRTFLEKPEEQFMIGPWSLSSGTAFGSDDAFVVEDVGLVSARWPGDAYFLARKLIEKVWNTKNQNKEENFE